MEVDPKKIEAETESMKAAIAQAMMTWAELENSLAAVLERLLGAPPVQRLGYAIYYTPSATETRFQIVTNVVKRVFPYNSAFGAELMACWHTFRARLNKAKSTRNAIAHGNVRAYGMGEPVEYRVRLVHPILDVNREEKPIVPMKWPGMSLEEVEGAAPRFQALRDTLDMIMAARAETLRIPYDWQASLNKVRALEMHLDVLNPPAKRLGKAKGK